MVLRIELAIVDDHRSNPVHATKRIGPDVDDAEHEPHLESGASVTEPEYIWDVPLFQQTEPQQESLPDQSTEPAPPVVPAQPAPLSPSLWSMATPAPQRPERRASAPAPTWAETPTGPAYEPEPPKYLPTYESMEQSAGAPAQVRDPLAGLQMAPVPSPHHSQAQSRQTIQSAPAAVARALTGFVSNRPPAVGLQETAAQPEAKSSSILTAGLTIGFALLVVVLVLVFIQLMTSLLR
jgi:hypothetical protein